LLKGIDVVFYAKIGVDIGHDLANLHRDMTYMI